jgi:hypothetical protein
LPASATIPEDFGGSTVKRTTRSGAARCVIIQIASAAVVSANMAASAHGSLDVDAIARDAATRCFPLALVTSSSSSRMRASPMSRSRRFGSLSRQRASSSRTRGGVDAGSAVQSGWRSRTAR